MNAQILIDLIVTTLQDVGLLNKSLDNGNDHGLIPLGSVEIDSLTAIELCMKLEECLGFPVEPTDILHHATIGDIARDLIERLASQK